MSKSGIERVRACFENMEEIFPAGVVQAKPIIRKAPPRHSLPQLPQLPPYYSQPSRALPLEEDLFEERAAIMEFDGGLQRPLAEFWASR